MNVQKRPVPGPGPCGAITQVSLNEPLTQRQDPAPEAPTLQPTQLHPHPASKVSFPSREVSAAEPGAGTAQEVSAGDLAQLRSSGTHGGGVLAELPGGLPASIQIVS